MHFSRPAQQCAGGVVHSFHRSVNYRYFIRPIITGGTL